MTTLEKIEQEALSLPPEQQGELIDRLIEKSAIAPEVEEAWNAEIASRIDDIKAGRVEGIPHDEVMRELRERAEQRRANA